ncbi:phage antirepressor [Parvimonas micra]
MQELKIFENEQFGRVRTLQIENEAYFIAIDVCNILGLTNPTVAISRLDEDEVTKFNLGGLSGETNIVNEYGLYNLILASRKPQAKAFKRWITHEVIPSIRKHGVYATDELLNNPDFLIDALTKLKEEREKRIALEIDNNIKAQQIGELKPKADYVDKILKSKSLMTITQIAKDYGMSGTKLNSILHELKVQYKQSNQWLLYSKYHDKGYTHSEPFVVNQADGTTKTRLTTKWTNKGRLFLYNLLKDSGYLPLIEME